MEELNITTHVSLNTVGICVCLEKIDIVECRTSLPDVERALTKVFQEKKLNQIIGFEPAAERAAGCEKQQVPQQAMQKTRRNP